MEQKKQENLYQKMNAVFQEKEELYQKREQEIKEYREELQRIESGIGRQKEELEQERKRIQLEKESLAKERQKMDEERKELEEYRESISRELEQILQEKLKLQSLENERLRQESEKESQIMQQSREALENLGQELSQEQKESGESADQVIQRADITPDPASETETASPKEETEHQEGAEEAADQEKSVGLIQQFAQKAKAVFPTGNILETTDEAFCIGIGDKELRILKQNPPAAVILARREKSKELLKGIHQFNLMQTGWEFSYQNNCLQCMMPFTEATSPDVVLEKCADAISRYFL